MKIALIGSIIFLINNDINTGTFYINENQILYYRLRIFYSSQNNNKQKVDQKP